MSSKIIKDQITPGVLSLLPLFYVGWSDSVLSPSEIKLIHKSLETFDFLTKADIQYLKKYTDPKNPPSPEVFKLWLKSIKEHSNLMAVDEKNDLVKLGINIAQSSSALKEKSIWENPNTKKALNEIQKALGVNTPLSSNILLNQINVSQDNELTSDRLDVSAMKLVLDGEHVALRDKMRRLLSDPLFELKHESDKDLYRLHTLERVKKLAEQGVSSFSFPKKYGGYEQKGDHIVVFEMLAYSDLSLTIKFGVQFGLFGGALYLLGTERHHRKYLEAMHRGELLGCFAMTETGHGSNVKGLDTTATYDQASDSIIIHSPNYAAGKEYIGNALHSRMAAVFAQLIVDGENHGVHALLVPLRNESNELLPGIKVEDCGSKIGLNGVDNGRIWFDNVSIPRENLLDKYGTIDNNGDYSSPIENPSKRFFTMLGALVVGRICVGAASINAAKKALTIATKYALKRRQFAPKDGQKETIIMDYPTHQDRLIPRVAHTYAYHFALRDLAEQYVHDEGDQTRKIETLAAGLKSKATWFATDTIQTCREACGGKGYLSENQMDALKGDSDIFTTFEGDNTVLMQLVAKGLLTEFKQSFHDEGIKAVIGFILKKAKHKINEYNALEKRNTDYQHLVSSDFGYHALRYRYDKTLITLSERMRKYLGRRMDPYQAFLKTQVHMVDLADAYIDMVVFDSFRDKIESSTDGSLRSHLTMLCQLYTLDTIYQNRGWFLENDYLEGNKSKAIRRARLKLIQTLRPNIGGLVDAFGIPDELIYAPIALNEVS